MMQEGELSITKLPVVVGMPKTANFGKIFLAALLQRVTYSRLCLKTKAQKLLSKTQSSSLFAIRKSLPVLSPTRERSFHASTLD